MSTKESPRYTHDCEHCKFLGRFGAEDLYVHPASTPGDALQETVIARSSSDGPDYASGMGFAFGQVEALTEARRRAQQEGLITYPFVTALQSLRRDSQELLDEFFSQSAEVPLYRLVQATRTGEATYERYAELARAFVVDKTERFGPDSGLTPQKFFSWFVSQLGGVVDLVCEPLEARDVHSRFWTQYVRFTQELSADISA